MGPVHCLLLLLVVVVAQRCEPFAGEPTICQGLVGYDVWVPPGFTQANISAVLISTGVTASALLPGGCARAAAVAACSAAFRVCGNDGLPLPLCINYCYSYATVCPLGELLNCSAVDPFLGPSLLWAEYTNRTGSLQECVIANESTPEINCPLPFIWDARKDSCAMKCPPIGLDDAHSNQISWRLMQVLGTLSVFSSVLVGIVSYHQWKFSFTQGGGGTQSSLRRLPKFAMLNVWIAGLLGWSGDIFPKWWNTWEEELCADKWTLRDTSSTSCFYTSITGYLGRTAHAYWVATLLYTLIMNMPGFYALQVPLRDSERLPLFPGTVRLVVMAWVIPTIQWLIVISNGWFNASNGPSACTADSTVHDGNVLLFSTLLPLTGACGMSTIIIFIFVVYLFFEGWAIAKSQWRFIMVCVVYVFCIWIVISFTWHVYTVRHEFEKRITYAITTSAASNGAIHYASIYDSPINLGWIIFVSSVTSAVPFLMSMVFISYSYLAFYKNLLLKGVCTFEGDSATAAVTVTAESTTSSTHYL